MDWQLVVVIGLAAGAAWYVFRRVARSFSGKAEDSGCANCGLAQKQPARPRARKQGGA